MFEQLEVSGEAVKIWKIQSRLLKLKRELIEKIYEEYQKKTQLIIDKIRDIKEQREKIVESKLKIKLYNEVQVLYKERYKWAGSYLEFVKKIGKNTRDLNVENLKIQVADLIVEFKNIQLEVEFFKQNFEEIHKQNVECYNESDIMKFFSGMFKRFDDERLSEKPEKREEKVEQNKVELKQNFNLKTNVTKVSLDITNVNAKLEGRNVDLKEGILNDRELKRNVVDKNKSKIERHFEVLFKKLDQNRLKYKNERLQRELDSSLTEKNNNLNKLMYGNELTFQQNVENIRNLVTRKVDNNLLKNENLKLNYGKYKPNDDKNVKIKCADKEKNNLFKELNNGKNNNFYLLSKDANIIDIDMNLQCFMKQKFMKKVEHKMLLNKDYPDCDKDYFVKNNYEKYQKFVKTLNIKKFEFLIFSKSQNDQDFQVNFNNRGGFKFNFLVSQSTDVNKVEKLFAKLNNFVQFVSWEHIKVKNNFVYCYKHVRWKYLIYFQNDVFIPNLGSVKKKFFILTYRMFVVMSRKMERDF